MYTRIYMYVFVNIFSLYVCMYIYVHIHIYIFRMYICMYIYIHIYMCVRVYFQICGFVTERC